MLAAHGCSGAMFSVLAVRGPCGMSGGGGGGGELHPGGRVTGYPEAWGDCSREVMCGWVPWLGALWLSVHSKVSPVPLLSWKCSSFNCLLGKSHRRKDYGPQTGA